MGQAALFNEIASEEEHACWVCGRHIHQMMYGNFAHILSKGAYPKLKLHKPNIKIMCFNINGDGCHNLYDTKAESDLMKRNPDQWSKVFKYKEKLKQQYYL